MTEARKKKKKLSRQDIGFLFKKGKIFREGKFILRWDFGGAGEPLLCVTTLKKNMKRAVERNRMRRLAREFFRKNQKQLKQGARIILQLGDFSNEKFLSFEQTMRKLFRSAGLIVHE